MDYMLDFEKSIVPVWDDGGEAYCESVLPYENSDGNVQVPLYFSPKKVHSVTMADLSRSFIEGRDYTLTENGLIINKNGAVPYLTQGDIYPA